MVDDDGYRPNVGIVISNDRGQVLWAKRIGQQAWQFPQGGIDATESPEDALYRELQEEVGLQPQHVDILACTERWLRYQLPPHMRRFNSEPNFIGQKQKWFLLKLKGCDEDVCVEAHEKPEFDHWRWVSYWYPLGQVIEFKKKVYRLALTELAPRVVIREH